MEMPLNVLGQISAGLSLIQVRALLRGAFQTGEQITYHEVARRKKQIIEQECHGLVEFVDTKHNFSHVGGMERVKRDLMRVADAVKDGQTNRVPMGMIFVGPWVRVKRLSQRRRSGKRPDVSEVQKFPRKWVGHRGEPGKDSHLVMPLGMPLIIDEPIARCRWR